MSADPSSVHLYYRLVDAGDVDGLVALFSPTTIYRRPGYEPLVGRDALRAFYEGARVIEEGAHDVEHTVVGADSVAVHGHFRGTLKDGSRVSLRFADFYTFDTDGLFATRDTFFFAPMV
ncbi:nuclear transport factor 2 family protein [Gephyromycinifex aptenodytis]|uniref:nuclear transport factor 2 family protein n=1 Tax=Gephyromycinifex aptenodytis TaxID=2716227 RepID=UPI0014475E20|nr:nuclear transport factor 2 family protein [Gephyromycinifex aptenodytis]